MTWHIHVIDTKSMWVNYFGIEVPVLSTVLAIGSLLKSSYTRDEDFLVKTSIHGLLLLSASGIFLVLDDSHDWEKTLMGRKAFGQARMVHEYVG